MIESGNKKEEYREIKKYWIGRLAKCGGRNSYEKTGFYCKKAILLFNEQHTSVMGTDSMDAKT